MEARPRKIETYVTQAGRSPFVDWVRDLRDAAGRRAISARIQRLQEGNPGDWKRLGDIGELRVSVGPGYRIYFGEDGEKLVILLSGGDKSGQSKDIERAKGYWRDYRSRP